MRPANLSGASSTRERRRCVDIGRAPAPIRVSCSQDFRILDYRSMSSPALSNGTQSESIARAARLSRYARHLLSANPVLAAEAAADSPFARDEMRARLSGTDLRSEEHTSEL